MLWLYPRILLIGYDYGSRIALVMDRGIGQW